MIHPQAYLTYANQPTQSPRLNHLPQSRPLFPGPNHLGASYKTIWDSPYILETTEITQMGQSYAHLLCLILPFPQRPQWSSHPHFAPFLSLPPAPVWCDVAPSLGNCEKRTLSSVAVISRFLILNNNKACILKTVMSPQILQKPRFYKSLKWH